MGEMCFVQIAKYQLGELFCIVFFCMNLLSGFINDFEYRQHYRNFYNEAVGFLSHKMLLKNKVAPLLSNATAMHSNLIHLHRFEHLVCRICLQGPEEDSSDTQCKMLIKPCNCTGSIQAVHDTCMLAWISSKIRHSRHYSETTSRKIFCQICKARIYYDYEKFLEWDFRVGCDALNRVNTCYLSGFICCIVFIVVLAVLIKNSELLGLSANGRLVLIVCTAVIFLCSLLIFIGILKIAFTKEIKKISKVYDISEAYQSNEEAIQTRIRSSDSEEESSHHQSSEQN